MATKKKITRRVDGSEVRWLRSVQMPLLDGVPAYVIICKQVRVGSISEWETVNVRRRDLNA